MTLCLIVARAANGVIGVDNTLPWRLPQDMAYFRRTTHGAAVIMGRKTWQSLPDAFRPLPKRRNIVLSTQADFSAPGAELARDLASALELAKNEPRAFILGGTALFHAALPHVERAYVTQLEQAYAGDCFFPELKAPDWMLASSDSRAGFAFQVFTRTQPAATL